MCGFEELLSIQNLMTLTGWLSARFTCRMRRSLRMSLRCRMGVPELCVSQENGKHQKKMIKLEDILANGKRLS